MVTVDVLSSILCLSGWQEEHLACKNSSAVTCKRFCFVGPIRTFCDYRKEGDWTKNETSSNGCCSLL